MSDIIELKNINFSYSEQDKAINDLSLTIKKGSYTTILGHNGSGKSTIAKLLIGLVEKESGLIKIDGLEMNLDNLYTIRKKIGIVFQNPDNQFIGSTVSDDIAFGLENHQVPSEQMPDIVLEYAKKVKIDKFLNYEPTKLSGGQKQRVAIAGILAMNPDIIIFDESTSMLDPTGKAEINQLINEIHKQKNITVISITHDMEQASKSDYVIIMDKGKVVLEGKPIDVLVNEKQLVDLSLDVPFSVKLVNEFKNNNIDLTYNLELERVVSDICQLNLKK